MATKKKTVVEQPAAERIAALEERLKFLQTTLEELLPKMADWCDKVDADRKTLFENDQKLKAAIEATLYHTHNVVPAELVSAYPILFTR